MNTDGPIPNAYRPTDEHQHQQYGEIRVRAAAPAGSPRPLAIARDIVIIVVGMLVIITAVLFALAANDAGNALDDLKSSTSTTEAPAICYVNPDDVTCPPGFDPNG